MQYSRLPWDDQILLLKTFVLLGIIRLAVLALPFRYLASYLGRCMQETPYFGCNEISYLERVSWAIDLLSRYTPWESKCLVQAITGKILIRKRRLENTLYLGVTTDEKRNLIAHAWLRSGMVTVTGEVGSRNFTVVAKFADFF